MMPQPDRSIRHRPDIDGLRAVAVIPVVAFHAFPSLAPGGFVGVDIFFVISGFLITSILIGDLGNGTFSLAGFYDRRVRRILPALCVCLAASAVAAAVLLPPSEMASFAKSLVSIGLFSSNVYFWRQGGYFDAPAHDKPLLHTWSLSVEEQFYLLWPVLLWLLWRFGGRRWVAPLVIAGGIASLGLAILLLRYDADGAFYLAPTRVWELALGALLAVSTFEVFTSRRSREIASAVGLAAIAVSVFAYSPATPFPGAAALLPCLGAALLIHSNRQAPTAVARLLSLQPVVFVGLISYSLYLWHWPVLVFGQIGLNRALLPAEAAVAVAASLAAAAFSWRYVEQPFRTCRPGSGPTLKVLGSAAASLLIVVAVGLMATASGGFHFRANAAVEQAEASVMSVNPRRPDCHVDGSSAGLPPLKPCILGRSGARDYQVLVWGDSHADHFAPAVAAWAGENALSARQATKSACRPLISGSKPLDSLLVSADCATFNKAVLAEAAEQEDLRAVIISGYWASRDRDRRATAVEFRQAFRDTLSALRGRLGAQVSIVVLGTTPVFAFRPATCFARASLIGLDRSRCAEGTPINAGEAGLFDPVIAEVVGEDRNAIAFLPWRTLCQARECETVKNATILYRDHSHFTVEGGRLVLQPLLERIAVTKAAAAVAP
jgi:peptidoglycan/LPS O-acetylase OafA/YrhL